MHKKPLIERIADRLNHIDMEEMSMAERQIARLFIDDGYAVEKEGVFTLKERASKLLNRNGAVVEVGNGKTITPDHSVREFHVFIRSQKHVGIEDLKQALERYEVTHVYGPVTEHTVIR